MTDYQLPKEALYNIGVKAAILRSDHTLLLLHIRRRNSTDTYWDLPGGRMVDGETPQQTLKREIHEETGMSDVSIGQHLIMTTSRVQLPVFDEKNVGVIFSLYACASDSPTGTPEDRITMHWCSIAEAVANLRENPDWPDAVVAEIAKL